MTLDGDWDVRRVSGALPPMLGITKRIAGDRGHTLILGTIGVPFDVRGLELHYRPPFHWIVDALEPDGEGYRGTTLVRGRTIGHFELSRENEGRSHRRPS